MGDQWVDLPLAVQESSGLISTWNLVNMLLLKSPPEAQRRFVITSVPALATSPITSGSGDMRGMLFHAAKLWYVRGTQLYYTSNGTSATLVGTVSGSANVQMIGAGPATILIVDGAGNEYTATTAAVAAVTPPAGNFSDCTWMDGWAIAIRDGTDEFYVSGLDDPTTWGALDFSTADAISDTLVGCIACNRDLFLLGKQHIEVWYDAGASPFPFVRASPGVIERGCIAASTVQKADGVVYFVGDDRRAYRLQGYTLEKISTEAMEGWLNAVAASSLSSSVYSFNDQLIYAVQVGASQTFEYNTTTGLWHRRTGFPGFRTNFTPSSTTNVYHAGEGLGGTVGVYRVDASSIDSTLTYSMTLPWFDMGGRRVFEHEIELIRPPSTSDTGTITLTTSDADDGLANLTHATVSMSAERLTWNRCGSFRRRQHTFTWDSPLYNIVVEAARARMDVGL